MDRANFFFISLWLKYFDYLKSLINYNFQYLLCSLPSIHTIFIWPFVSSLMEIFESEVADFTAPFCSCQACGWIYNQINNKKKCISKARTHIFLLLTLMGFLSKSDAPHLGLHMPGTRACSNQQLSTSPGAPLGFPHWRCQGVLQKVVQVHGLLTLKKFRTA